MLESYRTMVGGISQKNEQLLVNALKSYPRFLSVPESFFVPGPVPLVVMLRRRISTVRYVMCAPAIELDSVMLCFTCTPHFWSLIITHKTLRCITKLSCGDLYRGEGCN